MLSKESAEAIRTPKGLGLAIGLGLIAAPFTGGMSLAYMGCHVAVAAATQKKKPEQKRIWNLYSLSQHQNEILYRNRPPAF